MTFEGRESPDRGEIIDCPKCATRAYPLWLWNRMSKAERKASGGRLQRGGQCDLCARGGSKKVEPDPEPGEEFVEPECVQCEHPMITRSHWKKAGKAERAELLEEGYRVIHSVESGLCRRCNDKRKQDPS